MGFDIYSTGRTKSGKSLIPVQAAEPEYIPYHTTKHNTVQYKTLHVYMISIYTSIHACMHFVTWRNMMQMSDDITEHNKIHIRIICVCYRLPIVDVHLCVRFQHYFIVFSIFFGFRFGSPSCVECVGSGRSLRGAAERECHLVPRPRATEASSVLRISGKRAPQRKRSW